MHTYTHTLQVTSNTRYNCHPCQVPRNHQKNDHCSKNNITENNQNNIWLFNIALISNFMTEIHGGLKGTNKCSPRMELMEQGETALNQRRGNLG